MMSLLSGAVSYTHLDVYKRQVPETACEEFNSFLDRALVVGTPDEPSLGYFQLG